MPNKIWKLLKQLQTHISLSSSNFLSSIINSLFWLYLATVFDILQYGELGYLISIATVGSVVANIGFSRMIIVYGEKQPYLISVVKEFGIITGIVAAMITYVISSNYLISLLLIGLLMYSLMMAEHNGKKHYQKYALYNLLRRILGVAFGFGFLHIFGIEGIILGFLIATIPSIFKMKNLFTTFPNFSLFKSKLGFMLNNYFSSLTMNFFWWADKILIGYVFGFQILGNYQFASQYMILLNSIPNALFIFLVPQEVERIKHTKLKTYSILGSIFLSLISFLVIPFGIDTFFPEYSDSIFLIQIMSFGLIPITISIILESKYLGQEISKVILISTSIQLLVYFTLLVFLGYQYGLMGLAIAFLTATVCRALVLLIISRLINTD